MRKTAKKKLKGERLGCGIGLSAYPACIPPCFILLIAASAVVPKGLRQVICSYAWSYVIAWLNMARNFEGKKSIVSADCLSNRIQSRGQGEGEKNER